MKREDIPTLIYPAAARLRRLDKSHAHLFDVPSKDIEILKLRIDLLAFLKTFNSQARDIWKQEYRVQTIFSIILSSVDVSGFMVSENFKMKNGA